jgi:hypothetical protein
MAKTATYALIESQTLGSSNATVTFSSIPNTYTDLMLVVNYDSSSTIIANILMRFNSDTSTNYSYTYLQGTGSAAQSGRTANATYAEVGYQSTVGRSNIIINVQDYANTTTYKTAIARHNNPAGVVQAYVSLWRATPAAISTLTLSCSNQSFVTGSTFKLYGIQAGNA